MRVHLIAVGETAMRHLAAALARAGHEVSGSEEDLPSQWGEEHPRASFLPKMAGWFPEKISSEIEMLVVGRRARRDNPELLRARALGLRVVSLPECVQGLTREKKRLVVAGSFGKTTALAMAMHCLRRQKVDFDYVMSETVPGFDAAVRLSGAEVVLIEADEWPASVLDDAPAMVKFCPTAAIVTGIAWRRAEVFPTAEAHLETFGKLIDALPPEAHFMWLKTDGALQGLVEARKNTAQFYSVPFEPFPAIVQKGQQIIKLWGKPRVPMQAFGEHNLANAKAASLICRELGVRIEDFMRDLASFAPPPRRLELLSETPTSATWADMAEPAESVRAAIAAVKSLHPRRKLVACYALRAPGDFLPQCRHAMDLAEKAFVVLPQSSKISPETVRAALAHPDLEIVGSRVALDSALEKLAWHDRDLLLMAVDG